jgi:hypothetical protein
MRATLIESSDRNAYTFGLVIDMTWMSMPVASIIAKR